MVFSMNTCCSFSLTKLMQTNRMERQPHRRITANEQTRAKKCALNASWLPQVRKLTLLKAVHWKQKPRQREHKRQRHKRRASRRTAWRCWARPPTAYSFSSSTKSVQRRTIGMLTRCKEERRRRNKRQLRLFVLVIASVARSLLEHVCREVGAAAGGARRCGRSSGSGSCRGSAAASEDGGA